MLSHEKTLGILKSHDEYCDKMRPVWRRYRAALADRAWDDATTEIDHTIQEENPILVQVNRCRAWLWSYSDSLFHKGIRSFVRANPLDEPLAEADLDLPNVIGATLDTVCSHADLAEVTEQAIDVALTYGSCALKVLVDPAVNHPAKGMLFEVLPPWECVWDRKARNKKRMPYLGHVYWLSREEFLEKFPEMVKQDVKYSHRLDYLWKGASMTSEEKEDADHVRLLEFYDLTGSHLVEETVQGQKVKATAPGQLRIYLLDQGREYDEKPLVEKAMPYTMPDGKPASPMEMLIMVNTPEYPTDGLPAIANVWHQNCEENWSRTFAANAARRSAARKLLVQKDAFTNEGMTELTSGADLAAVLCAKQDGVPWTSIVAFLENPPMPMENIEYMRSVREARETSESLSPASRGEPLKYASATEISHLDRYTESTMGRLRKRLDKTVSRLLRLSLRVLQAAMGGKPITVTVGDDVQQLDPEALDRDWLVDLEDKGLTPMAEERKRAEFSMVQPVLMTLAATLSDPDLEGSEAQAMARTQIDYLVEIYGLPAGMTYDSIMRNVTEPEPAEEAPVQAPTGPSPDDILAAVQAGQLGGGPTP